jgi:hypothetical protein
MSKRKAITLETKYEVIFKRYKGAKACDLMQEYDLASSTVATIMKNKEKILAEYESNAAGSKRNQASSRIKQPTYQDIDNAVKEWQTISINKNVVISGPEIQNQALKYASILNHPEFKASNGWLQRFKERNQISFREISATFMHQAEEFVDEPEQVISGAQAMRGLDDFKKFLVQSSQDRMPTLKLVASIEKTIVATAKPLLQSKITSFFY